METRGFDDAAAVAALEQMAEGLQRAAKGAAALASLLRNDADGVDPRDPRNKVKVGSVMKLTPRGVEVCYQLFDAGLTRYAVADLMAISFAAATHRLAAYRKAGGARRAPVSLD
jgi:hypothetical protein